MGLGVRRTNIKHEELRELSGISYLSPDVIKTGGNNWGDEDVPPCLSKKQ